jgi:hypothetical protein
VVGPLKPNPTGPLDWFSARLKILIFIEGEGAIDTNLVVHVFRAVDFDDAMRRALDLGAMHTTSYKNTSGETVEWRFAEVLTLDNLGNADLDGREVHSLFTDEADPLPFETSLSPEDSDPGATGVPFLNVG